MPLRHPYRKWTAKDGCYSACMLEIEIINDPAGYKVKVRIFYEGHKN